MRDYIPTKEPEKMAWLQSFAEWIAANGAGHEIPPDTVVALCKAVEDADAACTEYAALHAAALDASAAKKQAMAEAFHLARVTAQRVQVADSTTDEDRAAAGITIPKTAKTSPPAGYIKSLPPPEILIKYTGDDTFAIHWGPNPSNGRKNARPAGTAGCELQIARGGIPSDDASWVAVQLYTKSPIIIPVDETDPGPNAYRARYLSTKLEKGPFSAPILFALGRAKGEERS